MKINNKNAIIVRAFTAVLLLFACFYMYDFYKSLSGFIANGFREPLVMLPMIFAFFLPVICFVFFVYDFYLREIPRAVKFVYSIFVAIYAVVVLFLIFSNLPLYISNNSFGVYDALPSIFIHFPYDMIVVLFALLALQLFNSFVMIKNPARICEFANRLKSRGFLHLSTVEYILLCVLAIVVFIFTGSSICALFTAFENIFFDFRFAFLLIWVLIVPMGNLVFLSLKPEKMNIGRTAKISLLGSAITVNIVFALLFFIFEFTYPDFLVHIGKPLFLIAFSVSLPIEPAIIFAVMTLSTVILTIRLIVTVKRSIKRIV